MGVLTRTDVDGARAVQMNTEQERRLARAWQAIAGWRVGMQLHGIGLSRGGVVVQIDSDGLVWVRHVDGREYAWSPDSYRCIPALDAPANLGHWLTWTVDTLGSASLRRSGSWWSAESKSVFTAESNSVFTAEHDTPAAALMELYCRCLGDEALGDEALGAARDWWEHEQDEEDTCQ